MSDRDILKSALAATPECLSTGQLEGLLDGNANNPHLAGCPRCQAELSLLKSFESQEPLAGEGAAVAWISSHMERQLPHIKTGRARAVRAGGNDATTQGNRFLGSGAWRWLAPATILAAAILIAVLIRPEKEPDLRADAGGTNIAYRSSEVVLVSPIGDLQEIPKALTWHAFSDAANYRITVMEIDNSPLWSAETSAASIEIPLPLHAKMLPGKPILWQVAALDAQGRILGTSQVQRFVTPREHSSDSAGQPH